MENIYEWKGNVETNNFDQQQIIKTMPTKLKTHSLPLLRKK